MIIKKEYKETKMLKRKKKSIGRKKRTIPTFRRRSTESYFNQGLGKMGIFKDKKVK